MARFSSSLMNLFVLLLASNAFAAAIPVVRELDLRAPAPNIEDFVNKILSPVIDKLSGPVLRSESTARPDDASELSLELRRGIERRLNARTVKEPASVAKEPATVHKPAAVEPKPPAVAPKLPANEPKPNAVTPKPPADEPKPPVDEPKPATTQPKADTAPSQPAAAQSKEAAEPPKAPPASSKESSSTLDKIETALHGVDTTVAALGTIPSLIHNSDPQGLASPASDTPAALQDPSATNGTVIDGGNGSNSTASASGSATASAATGSATGALGARQLRYSRYVRGQ
ncbi:hypothetical protein PLICRDRAFT_46751 [Plicaturopsis crispa FD-325 SS-3]|uniref:Uncharacterized protein n=1 Tax=Plicaturopsis crispa FD-325 SS-3 TaxID=944288 RepID=A0A0C9SQQ4_PLICR|nr:hypothetical protein PLICRDRAFT_46751 [Plicaturopsis crispa FD-325 SS-3]